MYFIMEKMLFQRQLNTEESVLRYYRSILRDQANYVKRVYAE